MNDAEKPALRPANENPWYWLATLYGEWSNDLEKQDPDIALKNRIAWNRWFAKELSAEQREELLKKGVSPEELVPWNPTEEAELVVALTARSGCKSQSLPDPTNIPDFSHTIFDNHVSLFGFLFPNGATFTSATFSRIADFRSATFTGGAYFRSARFTEYAHFDSATFTRYADFR